MLSQAHASSLSNLKPLLEYLILPTNIKNIKKRKKDSPRSTKAMSDSEEEGLNLFQEPEGFYKPEKEATFVSHKMLDGRELNLRLVGHNPLWV